ncbi:MAG: ABC transporter permease [Pseudomonadota bacterium]
MTPSTSQGFWRRYRRNRSAMFGLAILSATLLMSVLAPLIYPQSPFALVGEPRTAPNAEFWLGTDTLGRDVMAGIFHGARTSLLIGLMATLVSLTIGIIVGGIAGYYGGTTDNILMRLTEFFQTIPNFLFAIVLVAVMTPSIYSIIIAIAVVTWPAVARLVRGEFMALRNREFVQACTGIGMSDARILALHILPNCIAAISVIGSLMVATAILVESGLSFLGLGDPNVMSWGYLIGAGRTVLRTAWWVCTFPGIAILLTVLAINLVGEGLNDAFNPRLRDK